MKTIAIIILVAIGFVLYLFQHRCSVDATQEITKLEKTKQLLGEEVIAIESRCAKIFLFANLEQTAQQLNLIFPTNNSKHKNNQISNLPVQNPDNILITRNKLPIDN